MDLHETIDHPALLFYAHQHPLSDGVREPCVDTMNKSLINLFHISPYLTIIFMNYRLLI